MYCKNCGSEVDPKAAICVKCGYQLGTGNNFCHNCGNAVAPGANVCTSCGFAQSVAPSGEQKSKLVAVLLAFFLGSIGIHDFYLGYTKEGVGQLMMGGLCGLMTLGIATICSWIWAICEGIALIKGKMTKDANRQPLKP